MELCYDGALVMPSSYAVMSEEEMTYVEGGIAVKNWIVGGAINVGIAVLCGGMSAFFLELQEDILGKLRKGNYLQNNYLENFEQRELRVV